MNSLNHRCGTCEFFKLFDHQQGWCCRYAPIVIMDKDNTRTLWPEVNAVNDWCGEYESKNEK